MKNGQKKKKLRVNKNQNYLSQENSQRSKLKLKVRKSSNRILNLQWKIQKEKRSSRRKLNKKK